MFQHPLLVKFNGILKANVELKLCVGVCVLQAYKFFHRPMLTHTRDNTTLKSVSYVLSKYCFKFTIFFRVNRVIQPP